MKIINLESKGEGYSGLFTENYHQYYRFNISPTKHVIVSLKTLSVNSGYKEFINTWKDCGKSTKFLKPPVEIKNLTLDALKIIETNINRHVD